MSFTNRTLPRTIAAIAVARGASFLGDEVALLAIAFRAKASLGHFGVAAVLIAGAIPLMVLAAPSGLLVDRVRTRPLLLTVHVAQAAVCVGLAFSSSWLMILLVALLACGQSLAAPAWQALVPTLVRDDQLPAAYGMLQVSTSIAALAGPAVGGLLVAAAGFSTPLLLDAVSFALLATVAMILRVDRLPSPGREEASWRAATEGFRLIFTDVRLRAVMVVVVVFVLSIGVVNVAEIFFATVTLHAGPAGYGVLGLFAGAGALIASSQTARIAERFPRPERNFVVGCGVLCAAILGFSLTRALWQADILVFMIGAGNAIVNVNATVLFSRSAPEAVRGRVFAALQGTVSACTITALALGGVLLGVASPPMIVLGGAATAAVAVALTVGPVLRISRAETVTL